MLKIISIHDHFLIPYFNQLSDYLCVCLIKIRYALMMILPYYMIQRITRVIQ